MWRAELRHSLVAAHRGQVALVEIMKRLRTGWATQLSDDEMSCVAALGHGAGATAGKRLARPWWLKLARSR